MEVTSTNNTIVSSGIPLLTGNTGDADPENIHTIVPEAGFVTVKLKTIKEQIENLITVEDAAGDYLKVGNIISTLSPFNVQKALPPNARHFDVLKLSEKYGTIHEIIENKIYVEIHGEQCVTTMKAEATVYFSEGLTKVIGDGGVGRIGSFVQVISNLETVRELVNTDIFNWTPGMEDAVGRTGKIVRMFTTSDILVQFAWGPRIYFKAETLLQSYNDKVETQDSRGNWITAGNLVLINKSLSEFTHLQKKCQLPHEDEDYPDLPMQIVEVKEITIKAFSASKIVQVLFNGNSYFVNVECLELIDWVKDRQGNDLRVGDRVQITSNEEEFKSIQNQNQNQNQNAEEGADFVHLGSWVDEMSLIVGQVGVVAELRYIEIENTDSELNASSRLLIKVEFADSVSFYINPLALELFAGTIAPLEEDEDPNLVDEAESEVWEEIDRDTLTCWETLGEGGFGVVVRGEWTQNEVKRIVAIKQLKLSVTNKPERVAEFMNEAKIQFSLRHPNIIALLGVSLIDERDLWIVMDFVKGTDLQSLLFPPADDGDVSDEDNEDKEDDDDDVGLPFTQKLSLSYDMSNAMAFIHEKGYVHCDIKPENMMVDVGGKLYICDFGITKYLGNIDIVSFATQYTNNVGGTLYYISPECLGTNPATGKYRKPTFASDIFALGAVFFEVFTQTRLYSNQMAFVNAKVTNNPAILKRKLLELPEAIQPIVSKSLDFDRKARPSAQELCTFFHELSSQHN